MINVYLYALVAVCGLIMAVLNLNLGSLVAGICMTAVGGTASVQQYRRVKMRKTS